MFCIVAVWDYSGNFLYAEALYDMAHKGIDKMIEYREILKEDIPKIAKLYISLALYIKNETHDPYFEFNNLSEQDLVVSLKKDMEDERKRILVAIEKDSIVGFIAGGIIDCFLPFSNVAKVGYISAAYVSEENRNHGIMKVLEKMIANDFKEKNISYLELNVISNNFVGKKTWEKLGYNTFRDQMRKRLF